jgi:cystathionine gamma-lyase
MYATYPFSGFSRRKGVFMSKQSLQGIGTKLVHGGETPDPITGAVAPVLVRTKTFRQPVFGQESAWMYSRGKNPTRTILENKLEALLGEGKATVFGSGDAATTMLLLTLNPGDHLICCEELYGGTVRLLDQLFSRFGIKTSYVDVHDKEAVLAAKTDKTVGIFVESPTNPKLGIIDLTKVSILSQELGLRFIVDMTFAPPCTTNPFDYGAETIIYSLSKYFAGHNDVIGGAIVTKNIELDEKLRWLQWSVGAVLSPDECYRVIQELKTLELRWDRVSQSAQQVAEYLSKREEVAAVYYPGLATHLGHDIAKQQMKAGFGGTVSFTLATSDIEKISKFVKCLQDTELVVFAESLASPETILAHPATMSHRSLTPKRRRELGIGDNFFRLSVGFEDHKDILGALEAALQEVQQAKTVTSTDRAPASRNSRDADSIVAPVVSTSSTKSTL